MREVVVKSAPPGWAATVSAKPPRCKPELCSGDGSIHPAARTMGQRIVNENASVEMGLARRARGGQVDNRAPGVFGVRPLGLKGAIARALRNEDRAYAETRWCD